MPSDITSIPLESSLEYCRFVDGRRRELGIVRVFHRVTDVDVIIGMCVMGVGWRRRELLYEKLTWGYCD